MIANRGFHSDLWARPHKTFDPAPLHVVVLSVSIGGMHDDLIPIQVPSN